MEIETTYHVDADEVAADRQPAFFYEYALYRFSEGAIAIVARSYKDEPQEAHFLRIERDGTSGLLKAEDLQHALFAQAVSYLKGIGKERLSWLSERAGGYEQLASKP